jgi:hypothetical protein
MSNILVGEIDPRLFTSQWKCARIPLFLTYFFFTPFLTKIYRKKTQTEKKCERANTENRLPRIFSPYYYALSYSRKIFFSKKSYFIAIYYWRVLNVFTLLLKTVNNIKQKNIFFPKKLLHSYLLSKGAQYFYTFAENSK